MGMLHRSENGAQLNDRAASVQATTRDCGRGGGRAEGTGRDQTPREQVPSATRAAIYNDLTGRACMASVHALQSSVAQLAEESLSVDRDARPRSVPQAGEEDAGAG